MESKTMLSLDVTSSQKETLELRAVENGFDDLSAYLKVVALRTQEFNASKTFDLSAQNIETLKFEVSASQEIKIYENQKNSGFEAINDYLLYVALHGVVTSVIEVRSTGNLDSMLQRISAAKKKAK